MIPRIFGALLTGLVGSTSACSVGSNAPEECEDPCGGTQRCQSVCACERQVSDCQVDCGAGFLDSTVLGVQEVSAFEQELLTSMNAARTSGICCGSDQCEEDLGTLALQGSLQVAATGYAILTGERGYISHTGEDGAGPVDRIREAGFAGCAVGENLAWGQETADEVVEQWLASPAHCENLINVQYTYAGVGVRESEDGKERVWVATFGAP